MGRLTPTRLEWQVGEVVRAEAENPRVKSLTIRLPQWPGHRAGQHLDVRLTAEDGYQAVRSYSIASPPEDEGVALTVERLDDGEVSPYLVDEVREGDMLEFRGPIGGYFVWDQPDGSPLLLVAGGSGIVPLMSMIRHRAAAVDASDQVPIRLLYSARSLDDVIYRQELGRRAEELNGLEVRYALTRAQPPGWTGFARRVDTAMLAEVSAAPESGQLAYICGPTSFVEAVAGGLIQLGHPPDRIKTERFGPTGR